jgi:hypothetical protein
MSKIFFYGLFIDRSTGTVLVALTRRRFLSPNQLGFRHLRRALGAVLTGALLATLMFMVQRPPVTSPMVIVNAFCAGWRGDGCGGTGLLSVSRRCGGARVGVQFWPYGSCTGRGRLDRSLWRYHVSHSPPFTEDGMIVPLTGVGVLTSLVFLVGRDVYATMIVHNVLALKGVLAALVARGEVGHLERPSWPLLITAGASVLLLVGLHRVLTQQASGMESA